MFCNVGSWLKDRKPDASKTATPMHALLQKAGEPLKYLSPVEKLPSDQVKLPIKHKMQIHRKPQVYLVLGLLISRRLTPRQAQLLLGH